MPIDELLTLLVRRAERRRALGAGHDLMQVLPVHLEWVIDADFHLPWAVFREFHDKERSSTDCVSRVAMHRLGYPRALRV